MQLLECVLYFCILALMKLSSKEVPSKEVKTSEVSNTMILSHQVFNAVKCVCKSVTSERCQFLNRRYLPVTDVTQRRQDENASPRVWKEESLAMKEREPPDSWEMEFSDPNASSQSPIQKPWKGAAGLIPKTADIVKRPTVDAKEVKQLTSLRWHFTWIGHYFPILFPRCL